MPAQRPTFSQHLAELQHLLSIQLNLRQIEVALTSQRSSHEKATSLYSVKRDRARIFFLEDLPALITVYEEFTKLNGAEGEILALISIDIMNLSEGLRTGRWCATVDRAQKLVACRRRMMGNRLQSKIHELDEVIKGTVARLHDNTVKLDKVLFFSMKRCHLYLLT